VIGAANGAVGGFAGSAGDRRRASEFAGGEGLSPTEEKVYQPLRAEKTWHIDEIVETSGLNSGAVLATLFELERKGMIRQ